MGAAADTPCPSLLTLTPWSVALAHAQSMLDKNDARLSSKDEEIERLQATGRGCAPRCAHEREKPRVLVDSRPYTLRCAQRVSASSPLLKRDDLYAPRPRKEELRKAKCDSKSKKEQIMEVV